MDNPLQHTIDRVNRKKLNIIEPAISKLKVPGPVPKSNARRQALDILIKAAPDAARVLESAIDGNDVKEIQLRAAIEMLHHIVGKPKVQMDITHGVKPYNQIIRELSLKEEGYLSDDT